jgi:hypothetical protein
VETALPPVFGKEIKVEASQPIPRHGYRLIYFREEKKTDERFL